MKSALRRVDLIVKRSPIHGYGVFAGCDVKQGEVIEECYAYALETVGSLNNILFNVEGRPTLVLGNGMIYNHGGADYNAVYQFDYEKSAMIYSAARDIKKGEEIFITYGDNWFSSRHTYAKKTSRRFKLRQLMTSLASVFRGIAVTACIIGVIFLTQTYV